MQQVRITVEVNGEVVEQDRKEVVEALRALPEGVAREERALSNPAIARPKRLYISCDGVMYPTRYRQVEGDRKRIVYQEMKCDTVVRTYFYDAQRILDWYHLVEHVWEAARGLYSDAQAAKKWVSRCTGLLHESSGIGLFRYLERCRRSHASKPGGSAGPWQ